MSEDCLLIIDRLIEQRHRKGMTQKECADAFGVTLRAWQTYEQGVSEPKYEMLCRIADFYGVTTDYLLGREPVANPLSGLNIGVEAVDSDKFIEEYEKLPDIVKQVFIDTMLKLSDAAVNRDSDTLYKGWTAEQLHAELDRQLRAEETAKEKSGAS